MEERVQRSRMLAARDEFLGRMAGEARARLTTAASVNATAYAGMVKGLIKQGVGRLAGEAAVEVRCRPQDLSVVTKVAPVAAAELAAEAKAAGEERAVSISVVADPALSSSSGGVTLAAKSGTIRCDNTLEARLELALADLTPVVRDLLFPSARAEVRVKPPVVIAAHAMSNLSKPKPAAAAPAAHAKAAPAKAAAATPAGGDPFAF